MRPVVPLTRRVLAIALCIAAGAFAGTAAAAQSQPTSPATAKVTATLESISPQVRATDSLRVEFRVVGALPGDVVRLSIFARVGRARLRQIIDGSATPSRGDYNPVIKHVSELTDPNRSTLVLNVSNDLLPQTPGVYPIQITIGSSRPITSWLIRVGAAASGDAPYSVSLVVPLRSPTALQPDGTIKLSVTEQARLDDIAAKLEGAPAGALTVIPNPETLDSLDASGPEARATLEHLQKSTKNALVLASTYVPIDIEAWRRAGRESSVAQQLRAGADTLSRTLARASGSVTSRVAVLGTNDGPGALESLRREGAVDIVVPDTQVEPPQPSLFPSPFAQTFRVRDAGNQDLLAASADSWMTEEIRILSRTSTPGVAVQDIVADMAGGFFDQPSVARGSVVLFPEDWAPSSGGIDTLFRTLSAESMVKLRDLDSFFATVSRASPLGEGQVESVLSGPMARPLVSPRGGDIESLANDIDGARSALDSYGAIFGPTTASQRQHFDKLLLASNDTRLSPERRREFTTAITAFVDHSLRTADGKLALSVPESERITLTSRRETIRLSIENRLLVPANVRIDLRAEKLAFPNGASLSTTLQPGANVVAFDVEVKTSGDSLLEYSVNAPQGSLGELAKGKLRIRSFALSGLGVVLSAIAIVVLATWWIRHSMHSRRRRRVQPEMA